MKLPHLAFLFLAVVLALGMTPPSAAQEIRLAAPAPPGTAQRILADRFKELLEASSEGLFTVVINPDGMSTKESEAFEQVRTGALQMGVIAASTIEPANPITRVLAFPYLFRSEQQADAVLDGQLGATILRDLETVGCKGLGIAEGGFKHLTNDIRPVRTVDDLKGLKIRVMASPLQTAFWIALGALPTPRSWPIYADMEWGRIDGQDSPLRIVEAYGFHEVQKYLSLTRHAYVAYLTLASLKWWDTLSQHDQELIQTAMSEASRLQRREQRARDEARLIALAGKGMVIERNPDLASFRAKAAGMQEMPFFREPRVQVLLTRMLAAAGSLPDPAPAAPAPAVPTGEMRPAAEQAASPSVDLQPRLEQPATIPGPSTRDEQPAPLQPPPQDRPTGQATGEAAPTLPGAATQPQAQASPSDKPARIIHPGTGGENAPPPIIEERIPSAEAPADQPAAGQPELEPAQAGNPPIVEERIPAPEAAPATQAPQPRQQPVF